MQLVEQYNFRVLSTHISYQQFSISLLLKYMKIHVSSMLAIGVDKHTQHNTQTQQTNKQTSSHNGFIKHYSSHHGLET